MVLADDGMHLYAVGSVDGAQEREIVMLRSEDNWQSATAAALQHARGAGPCGDQRPEEAFCAGRNVTIHLYAFFVEVASKEIICFAQITNQMG